MKAADLLELVRPHREGEDLTTIVRQKSLLRFLESQRTSKRVVLYGSAYDISSLFVHSVLVPASSLRANWDDLPNWQGNPFDSPSCSLVTSGGKLAWVEYSESWTEHQPKALKGAKQLVFARSFDGHAGAKQYFELAQMITLAHGLHWVDERQSWCRLNDEGDLVDLAGVEQLGEGHGRGNTTLVWLDRELLEMHMSATKMCLIQMFDSTRAPDEIKAFSGGAEKLVCDKSKGLSYKFRIADASSSYFRGVQVIKPARTAKQLGKMLHVASQAPKEFETFLVQDFKNDRMVDCSCNPKAMASYFEKGSPLPFETSPVFFNAAVMDRYKADPEKYRIKDRSIGCRNSWYLQTYDVNEAGQVHTMIKYLGDLPISEQRYWKVFNEPPKAPISKRSFQTDFEGNFDLEPDGLRDLKGELLKHGQTRRPWFVLRQPDLVDRLHYPLTSATKAWDDALIDLAKCAVEGLEKAYLVKVAKAGGRHGEASWGSIRWLREALLAQGVDEDRAEELVKPFGEVQHLRTKLSAHASGDEAAKIRRELLKTYKKPKAHVEAVSARLAHSLEALTLLL